MKLPDQPSPSPAPAMDSSAKRLQVWGAELAALAAPEPTTQMYGLFLQDFGLCVQGSWLQDPTRRVGGSAAQKT